MVEEVRQNEITKIKTPKYEVLWDKMEDRI
jgi:hypothetical protein